MLTSEVNTLLEDKPKLTIFVDTLANVARITYPDGSVWEYSDAGKGYLYNTIQNQRDANELTRNRVVKSYILKNKRDKSIISSKKIKDADTVKERKVK